MYTQPSIIYTVLPCLNRIVAAVEKVVFANFPQHIRVLGKVLQVFQFEVSRRALTGILEDLLRLGVVNDILVPLAVGNRQEEPFLSRFIGIAAVATEFVVTGMDFEAVVAAVGKFEVEVCTVGEFTTLSVADASIVAVAVTVKSQGVVTGASDCAEKSRSTVFDVFFALALLSTEYSIYWLSYLACAGHKGKGSS